MIRYSLYLLVLLIVIKLDFEHSIIVTYDQKNIIITTVTNEEKSSLILDKYKSPKGIQMRSSYDTLLVAKDTSKIVVFAKNKIRKYYYNDYKKLYEIIFFNQDFVALRLNDFEDKRVIIVDLNNGRELIDEYGTDIMISEYGNILISYDINHFSYNENNLNAKLYYYNDGILQFLQDISISNKKENIDYYITSGNELVIAKSIDNETEFVSIKIISDKSK